MLAGYNTGLEYFEMHRAARICMFIGYVLIGIWGLILFRYKRTDPRLRPGLVWDGFLWLSSLALLATAVYGIWDNVQRLK